MVSWKCLKLFKPSAKADGKEVCLNCDFGGLRDLQDFFVWTVIFGIYVIYMIQLAERAAEAGRKAKN